MSKISHLLLLVLFPCLVFRVAAQPSGSDNLDLNRRLLPIDSSNLFSQNDQYVWCNSTIKGSDGKYHLFYARWPHGQRTLENDPMNSIFDGFRGWLKYSQIAYAVSDSLTGPYRFVKTIIKGDGDPDRWDRFTMHNPQIRSFGGKYYLYYISNSFDPKYELKNAKPEELHWLRYNCTQKIGVLVANSIEDLVAGRFRRVEQPLMQPDNVHTFEVTNNPSVAEGPDRRYYMIFKSRKPNVGNMTHWMAVADRPDAPFTLMNEVFTSADMACEDPCLWYDQDRKRFYAVVKYYSHSGKLVPQFGSLALITSQDGRVWEAAVHPLVSLRQLAFKNGTILPLDRLERPFVVTDQKGQPLALLAAASQKPPAGILNPKAGQNTFSVIIPLK